MRVSQLQQLFAITYAHLVVYACTIGYRVTHGATFRDPDWGIGHPNSLHGKRLAGDLNLFRDGDYLTESADYEPLGIWWEAQTGWYLPDGQRVAEDTPGAEFVEFSWGGRFGDGGHFSIKHGGMR